MRKLSMLLVLLLAGALLTIPAPVKATGTSYWAKTYGGGGYDEAYAVAVAKNGDIIVVGGLTASASAMIMLLSLGSPLMGKSSGSKPTAEATGMRPTQLP